MWVVGSCFSTFLHDLEVFDEKKFILVGSKLNFRFGRKKIDFGLDLWLVWFFMVWDCFLALECAFLWLKSWRMAWFCFGLGLIWVQKLSIFAVAEFSRCQLSQRREPLLQRWKAENMPIWSVQ